MEYVYGALLLHKLKQPVNESNLHKVVTAAGVQADDGKVKALIASLSGVDIDSELANASVMSMSAPAAAQPKKEEKKEEEKPSESAAGLASLFG